MCGAVSVTSVELCGVSSVSLIYGRRRHCCWGGSSTQCSIALKMAKRCVCEMLTNLCWASIQHRNDVRLSANWMWAAKLDGEGARMYEACEALCDALISHWNGG